MKFHRINITEREHFQPGIVAIEQSATYPLGDDFFQLDHGHNYFAFFDRLGEVNYYAALDNQQVAAVGAGILRQIPYRFGETIQPAWYLCDLKVHPQYQHQHLSWRILRHALYPNILRCAQGYAILMNPGDGSPNRLARIFERLSFVKFRLATTLNIYSLDAATMHNLEPLLAAHRGEISYLSLRGIKDLRLQSTGQMLPLLHVQWGASYQIRFHHPPCLKEGESRGMGEGKTLRQKKGVVHPDLVSVAKGNPTPIPGYTHMFCAPETDDLSQILTAKQIYPNATASVISHGMDNSDWRFILTSDI
jgi:hypothetical protein